MRFDANSYYYRFILRGEVVHIVFSSRAIPELLGQVNPFGEAQVRHSKKPLQFTPFQEGVERWGFADSLVKGDPTPEGELCYAISPPRTLFQLDDKGYEPNELALARSLGESLNVIGSGLRFVETPEGERIEAAQAITVVAFGEQGMGWPMAGTLSPGLMRWLEELQIRNPEAMRGLLLQVRQAMFLLYIRARPSNARYTELYQFRAEFEGGPSYYLGLDVPGDACGLYGRDDLFSGHGFVLNCHNLDSPIQAYAFLAGLAKLDELAWQDWGR